MTVNSRKALATFISVETAGGLVLFAAAIAAMTVANSAFAANYATWWSMPVSLSIGDFAIDKTLILWISDGLMAVFSFLIGLEVKRELFGGQLFSWKQASLPRGMCWQHIYGFSCLAGIGFTMSLVIGGLAYDEPEQIDPVKTGVLGGSIMSALTSLCVLYLASAKVPSRRRTGA